MRRRKRYVYTCVKQVRSEFALGRLAGRNAPARDTRRHDVTTIHIGYLASTQKAKSMYIETLAISYFQFKCPII